MELVRVTNTQARLLHLPDHVQKSGDEKNLRIVGIGTGKTLLPGGNNVAREEWSRAKEHPAVKQWIAKEWIKEGGDTAAPEGPLAPLTLVGEGEDAARMMIEGEDSREILSRWLSLETRPAIKQALQRRLEAVGGSEQAPAKAAKAKG